MDFLRFYLFSLTAHTNILENVGMLRVGLYEVTD